MRTDRRHRRALRVALVAISLPVLLTISACGSDESSEQAAAPAPSRSDFPAPDGRTTEEIFAATNPTDDVVVSPTGQVFHKGENRFGFGVFGADRTQITDAEVAIYAGRPDGPAQGPHPARVESLATEPQFAAKSTSDDPDAAKVVYVADLELDRNGEWRLVAVVREGDTLRSVRIPSIVAGAIDSVPRPGDKAPRIHTPTADEVSDLDQIDTRDPHDTMHETDFADVVGEKPVVLLFATPLLCQSRVCGPVVDVAEQLKATYGDEVEFIHMEIFEDNSFDKGERPQVKAYGLPTEPWLFVVDENGKVSSAIEGAFGADELEQAVQKVTG